jgi:hypothetical protein
VPWDDDKDNTGVALSGDVLHFLNDNKVKYNAVLNKVLYKA